MVDAAILCGGLGTRLRSIPGALPKAMMPVGGRPFLEFVVRDLIRQGVGRIVFCAGYRHETIVDHFGRGDWGAEILFACEPAPLGTAGALRHALDRITTDPFLALNGDSVAPFDLATLLVLAATPATAAAMVVAPAGDRSDAGAVACDARGRVVAFAEMGTPSSRFHSAGIYVLPRTAVASLPAGRNVSLEREVLPSLIPHGIATLATAGFLIDIGTPSRLAQAQSLLADQLSGK